MELLRASVPTIPEFSSLSLVIRPEAYNDPSLPMVEPLIIASPLSSIPGSLSMNALKELHFFITSTLGRAEDSTVSADSRVVSEIFKDDQKGIDELQVFRPLGAYGVGLCYRFIRGDNALVLKLAAALLSSQKSSAKAAAALKPEEDLFGVLLCVGITGLSVSSVSSLTQYQIGERLSSCKDVLNVMGKALDISAVKTLMSTLLLHEDDYRITNARANAVNFTSIPEIDETTEKKGLLGRRSSMVQKPSAADAMEREEVVLPLALRTAEIARTMSENMKVLSVSESDTILRKYTVSGLDRKANLDLTGGGGKSRFNRKRSSGRDPDMDNFDYKGPLKEAIPSPQTILASPQAQHQQHQPFQQQQGGSMPLPKKDTGGKKSGALSAPKGEQASGRRGKGAQFTDEDSSQLAGGDGAFDPFGQRRSREGRRGGRQQFDDDEGTVNSQSRLQVNIALNEDLSCSYRSSQLSSCTVEGVVQIQVKSSAKTSVPFFLLMRDPARHVESFVQNKKFADDVSDALMADEDADRKFTVSVPKDDTYFPVVRYKCTDELRPVPMVSPLLSDNVSGDDLICC